MFSLAVIAGMIVLALRILWDGQIAVSRTLVATGLPLKLFGIALLVAGPFAFAMVIALTAAGQAGLISFRVPDDAQGAFWAALLLPPAVAAMAAILMAKPKDQVPPPRDDGTEPAAGLTLSYESR
jgi:hypothetical protein